MNSSTSHIEMVRVYSTLLDVLKCTDCAVRPFGGVIIWCMYSYACAYVCALLMPVAACSATNMIREAFGCEGVFVPVR